MNDTQQLSADELSGYADFRNTAVIVVDGALTPVTYKQFRASGSGSYASTYEVFGQVFGGHDDGIRSVPARLVILVTDMNAAGPTCAEFETTDTHAVALAEGMAAGKCVPAVLADRLDELAAAADAATCVGLAAFVLRTAGNGAVAPVPRVHVRAWLSGVVEVTDLEHAGKRGKKCRRARYHGGDQRYAGSASPGLTDATRRLIAVAHGFDPSRSFDEAVAALGAVAAERRAEAGPTGDVIDVEHSLIRGVDAPVFRLRAVGPTSAVHPPRPTFEAHADGGSGWIENTEDVFNGQTWTNRGNPRKAYAAAAKVWDKVKAAKTHREAIDVLEAAGIEFRSYCSVD